MKECKNCGHILEDDMLFCQKCGTKYEEYEKILISEDIIEEVEQSSMNEINSEEIIEVEESNIDIIEVDEEVIIPVRNDVSYSLNNNKSAFKEVIKKLDKAMICKIIFGVVAFLQLVFAVELYESYAYVMGTGAVIGTIGFVLLIFSLHNKGNLINKSIYALLISNTLILIGLSITAIQISAIGYILIYLFAILPDIVFWYALLKKINHLELIRFEQFEFLYYVLPFVKPIIFICGIADAYVGLAYVAEAVATAILAYITNKDYVFQTIGFESDQEAILKKINKKYIVLGTIATVIIALVIVLAIPEKDYSHIEGEYQVYRVVDQYGDSYYEDDLDDYLYLDVEEDGTIEFDYYDSYDEECYTQWGNIKAEINYSKITSEGLDDYDWEDADYYYRIKFNDGLIGYLAFFADDTKIMLYYYGIEYKILDPNNSLFTDYDYDYDSGYSSDYSYDSYDDDSAGYDPNDPYYNKHDYDNDGELTVDEWKDAMGEAIEDMYNGTYEY